MNSHSHLEAYEAQREGIQRVLEKANRNHPGWSDLAYAFLVNWVQRKKYLGRLKTVGHRIIVVDVVEFAAFELTEDYINSGNVQPHDLRAWGGVYQRAQREGLIERIAATKPSPRRHGTQSIVWRIL